MELMGLQAADVDTICNVLTAMFIACTATTRSVEQAARERGIIDFTGFFVFKCLHTALSAAIAEPFPIIV